MYAGMEENLKSKVSFSLGMTLTTLQRQMGGISGNPLGQETKTAAAVYLLGVLMSKMNMVAGTVIKIPSLMCPTEAQAWHGTKVPLLGVTMSLVAGVARTPVKTSGVPLTLTTPRTL